MLIQFHILQNYAPANLNRDDTGSPKDAMFGGHLRGRISSQCLKRTMRRSEAFARAFGAQGLLGARTKALPAMIQTELQELGASAEEVKAIVARVPELGKKGAKAGKDDESESEAVDSLDENGVAGETRQLIFVAPNECRPLAEKLLASYRAAEKAKPKSWRKLSMDDIRKQLGKSVPLSVDIGLFGRMTTDAAFEDVQAAAQVAHALSTNALMQEFDYYTAVDDLSGESGAGMIGDVEYNSCTYYKYLNVHWEELVRNLGGDSEVARAAVIALLEAAVFAQPGGKQNSFAAFNPPDFMLLEVSERNLPVNLANAFLSPARATASKTLVDTSVEQLVNYAANVTQVYGLEARRATLGTNVEYKMENAESTGSLKALKAWLSAQLHATAEGK